MYRNNTKPNHVIMSTADTYVKRFSPIGLVRLPSKEFKKTSLSHIYLGSKSDLKKNLLEIIQCIYALSNNDATVMRHHAMLQVQQNLCSYNYVQCDLGRWRLFSLLL